MSRLPQLALTSCGWWLIVLAGALPAAPPELVLQTGHSRVLSDVFISADGARVLTGSYDGTALLWDARSGATLQRFYRGKPIASVSAPVDLGFVVLGGSGADDNYGYVLDASTGIQKAMLSGHYFEPLVGVRWSADGSRSVSASKSKVMVWDARTSTRLREIDDEGITCAAISGDGKFIVTGSSAKHKTAVGAEVFWAAVWNADTGARVVDLKEHAEEIYAVALSANGKRVVTGSTDRTASIWNADTGERLQHLTGFDSLVSSVAITASGDRVVVAACNRTATVWHGNTGKRLLELRGPEDITGVAITPDGRRIVTRSPDAAIVWNGQTGEQEQILGRRTANILSLAASEDGARIVSSCGNRAVVWDGRTGERVFSLKHAKFVRAVAISPDGKHIVTGGGDKLAVVWNGVTGERVRELAGHGNTIMCAAVSADGGRVVTGSFEGETFVWNGATGEKLLELPKNMGAVNSVAISADGSRIVTGGKSPQTVVWDGRTGAKLHEFNEHGSEVTSVCLTPDGSRLAAAGSYSVVVWNAVTGDMLHKIERWKTQMHGVAISRDGARLAFGATAEEFNLLIAKDYEAPGFTAFQVSDPRLILTGDGDRLISANSEGAIAVRSVGKSVPGSIAGTPVRHLAQLIAFDDGREWLAITLDGYFNGSLEARTLVRFRVGEKLAPIEQYERRFLRPDVVRAALQGLPLPQVTAIPDARGPPLVELRLVEQRESASLVQAVAAGGGPQARIATVDFLVNGRKIPAERERSVVREQTSAGVVFRALIDLPPGDDGATVTAVAADDFDLQSVPARLLVKRGQSAPKVSSTLHVLTVGVTQYHNPEYNLAFAHADAENLASLFESQAGKVFSKVSALALVNEHATTPKILAALAKLQTEVRPADVVILMFSGHGVRTRSGLYYVTHEADEDNLRETCLNWQELDRSLAALQAKQVIFFCDCCHAGAFGDRAATQDQLAERLISQAGVMVFASSRGDEKSLESEDWRHGAFAKALLDGLGGEADLIRDDRISMSELQTFVSSRVKNLTGDRQHPFIPRMERFDPELVLAAK